MASHKKDTERLATAIEALNPSGSSRVTDRPRKAEEQSKLGFGLWLARKLYVSDTKSRDARKVRNTYPIHGYVGPNGGGKSACMVNDAMPALRAGRTVLSTVRLIDPDTGEDFPSYVKFESWDQLLDLHDADVLMDEMVGIANSRGAMSLDQRVQNILVQLRRRNIVLRWSAPNWKRADVIVREVTQAVTECRGMYPDRRLVKAGKNDAVQLWAPKRLFVWSTYDTIEFEDWSQGKRDKLTPLVRERYYGPGSEVFRAYDTLDAVSMVAGITEQGLCNICNKKRRVETCKGHTDEERELHDAATHVHFQDLGPVAVEGGRASELFDLADVNV